MLIILARSAEAAKVEAHRRHAAVVRVGLGGGLRAAAGGLLRAAGRRRRRRAALSRRRFSRASSRSASSRSRTRVKLLQEELGLLLRAQLLLERVVVLVRLQPRAPRRASSAPRASTCRASGCASAR